MSEKEKKELDDVSGGHFTEEEDEYFYRCTKCGKVESIYFYCNRPKTTPPAVCKACGGEMKLFKIKESILKGEKVRYFY